jgi:protein-tyrosine-phosphatase
MEVARLTLTIVALTLSGAHIAAQDPPRPPAATANDRPPTILFMCPHGAAKSVLASAYFRRAAKERGLNVRVESAGTEPDPNIAPVVANHLKKNGYDVPSAKPRRATASDMADADVVVSIGCSLENLPPPRGTLLRWDDVPAPSEDFAKADQRIRERVMELVDELVKQQRR